MKSPRHGPTPDGFTMVEVVVTTFITLIGLLGIHQLLFYMMYANAVSAQTTLATALAQDKMEELMGRAFDDIDSGADESAPFSRTWTAHNGTEGFKDIAVVVTWSDLRHKAHEIELRSTTTDDRLNAEIDMFQNNPIGSQ